MGCRLPSTVKRTAMCSHKKADGHFWNNGKSFAGQKRKGENWYNGGVLKTKWRFFV